MFESPNGLVITTREVMEQGWPILLVTDDRTSGIPVHAEHVVERDPSVAELADLEPGWKAWRTTVTDAWTREPMTDDD